MSPASKKSIWLAASNSYSDLLTAVDKAATLVAAAGGGVVSMSWGSWNFPDKPLMTPTFKRRM